MAVSPEPELTIARCAPQGRQRKQVERGSISELLAETNGSYTTSELSLFSPQFSPESQVSAFSLRPCSLPPVLGTFSPPLPFPACHAERNREERVEILTMQSKHPYLLPMLPPQLSVVPSEESAKMCVPPRKRSSGGPGKVCTCICERSKRLDLRCVPHYTTGPCSRIAVNMRSTESAVIRLTSDLHFIGKH